MKSALCFAAALLAFAPSCSPSESVSDRGILCAEVPGRWSYECTPIQSAFEQVLKLRVDFKVCLSGSCDKPEEASCQVTRDGNSLNVTAKARWSKTGQSPCSLDCNMITAECTTEPLPDGNYEIHYAGKTIPITFPSARYLACTDRPGGSMSKPSCCDKDSDCSSGRCDEDHVCR